MEEEKLLIDRFGKDAGFCVPEGYFEEFAARMTAALPRKKETLWVRLRPLAVAASMFGVIAGAGVWIGNNQRAVVQQQTLTADSEDEYIIFDNDDIYAYLTDTQ